MLLEEQFSDQLKHFSTSMTSVQQRRMMPHGMSAKSFSYYNQKNQRQIFLQQEQAKKRTNTEFDILDQMLTLAPISYNQYQVLQTTCYHMLNFNELLMTEKFINDIFGDLKCCLTPPTTDNLFEMEPAEASKDILHTYAELIERSDPNTVRGVLVRDQLLQKIDIVKEALTSPGACREYDYERLEFYGDSIIGFLVILELFVTQPTMVEGDLDFKRIQKVSNLKFYEVNEANKFYEFMITEAHQVYSGYDHAGFEPSVCVCQQKKFCTCKRSSCKITQKHQNELQNKLSQLRLIRERLKELDPDDDDFLKQIFMRGNIYQLAEMINKDEALANKFKLNQSMHLDQSTYMQQNQTETRHMTETEKVHEICVSILTQIQGGPRTCLLENLEKVIQKVESQIIQKQGKSGERNKRQKGPFYYKQLADVVESVTGAVTLACGLNCTQDYLRKIGVLEYDQAHLMREMTKLIEKQREKSLQLDNEFYKTKKMNEVETILGYEFSCKAWLIEALTHKSYSKEHEKQNGYLEDYERLEFLGDSVLGYLMARHFFLSTQKDGIRKNPKELHKMKTSVINNNLLSLIVIENKIHEYMIYNTKAPSFYEQFEKYVSTVLEMTKECGTTKDLVKQKNKLEQASKSPYSVDEADKVLKAFDLDTLHEHNLKIFGDVFESLIGAVFLDSQSVEKTWEILEKLISPYVEIYANLDTLQDHSRTLLLEMWNQKPYTKKLTCKHRTDELENGERSRLQGIIVGRDRVEHVVFAETFTKDAKSKIRTFYKHFYQLIKKFVDEIDLLSEDGQKFYSRYPEQLIREIKKHWEKQKEEERKKRVTEENYETQTQKAATQENIEESKNGQATYNNVIVEEAAQEEEEFKYDPIPLRRDNQEESFDIKGENDDEMTKR